MASDLSEAQRLKAKRSKADGKSRGGICQRVNSFVEPPVRAGFGSPGLFPSGLIVLETSGRRSGKKHRTPVVATLAPGGYLWVSTVLGRRANWLQNAQANSDVRYWLKGRALEGRALVSAPGYAMPDLSDLPPLIRWAATQAVKTSRVLHLGVVIIVPKVADSPPAS